jgi:hypothetical protein
MVLKKPFHLICYSNLVLNLSPITNIYAAPLVCFPLKRISCLKILNNIPTLPFTQFVPPPPKKKPSVHFHHTSEISHSTSIRGNCHRKWRHIQRVLPFTSIHLFHGACVINNMKNCGFNGQHSGCNCFTWISIIWSILPAKFIYLSCSCQILSTGMYVQFSSSRAITEHVMSMTTRSKTSTKRKLLLRQEKVHIINKVVAT